MNSQIPNLISIAIAFTPSIAAIHIWTELAYLNFHLKTALLMYYLASLPWKWHERSLILFSIRACFVLFIQNRLSENHKTKVNGIASNWNHFLLFILHTYKPLCVRPYSPFENSEAESISSRLFGIVGKFVETIVITSVCLCVCTFAFWPLLFLALFSIQIRV